MKFSTLAVDPTFQWCLPATEVSPASTEVSQNYRLGAACNPVTDSLPDAGEQPPGVTRGYASDTLNTCTLVLDCGDPFQALFRLPQSRAAAGPCNGAAKVEATTATAPLRMCHRQKPERLRQCDQCRGRSAAAKSCRKLRLRLLLLLAKLLLHAALSHKSGAV